MKSFESYQPHNVKAVRSPIDKSKMPTELEEVRFSRETLQVPAELNCIIACELSASWERRHTQNRCVLSKILLYKVFVSTSDCFAHSA